MGKIGEKLKERFGPPTFFPPTVFYRYFVELSSRCLGLFMFRWVLFFLCVGKQRPCEKPARIGWFLDTNVASIAVNMLHTSPYALFFPRRPSQRSGGVHYWCFTRSRARLGRFNDTFFFWGRLAIMLGCQSLCVFLVMPSLVFMLCFSVVPCAGWLASLKTAWKMADSLLNNSSSAQPLFVLCVELPFFFSVFSWTSGVSVYAVWAAQLPRVLLSHYFSVCRRCLLHFTSRFFLRGAERVWLRPTAKTDAWPRPCGPSLGYRNSFFLPSFPPFRFFLFPIVFVLRWKKIDCLPFLSP